MLLPKIPIYRQHKKQRILSFGGLNLSESFSDGDTVRCEGLSSAAYPIITQRKSVAESDVFRDVKAAAFHGKRIIINGRRIYIDGEDVAEASAGAKKFAAMGKRILIFPDKLCINIDTKQVENLQASFDGEATFTASTAVFEVGTDLSAFKAGDGIRITGSSENDKTAIIRGVSENVLTFDEDSLIASQSAEHISIVRYVPAFDCVCESGNRIWGTAGDIIYASALGDPTNYEVYDSLSTDSYTVGAASPGKFTACISYGQRVLFFKENEIYTLYGTKPSNYQLTSRTVPGVASGAERTLVAINECLFYKGTDGVYAYTGDIPVNISYKLGARRYEATAAGAIGTDYYISMNGKIYCYDTVHRIWTEFFNSSADWFLDGAFVSGGVLCEMGQGTERVKWVCEFTPFTEYTENRKCYSRIYIRYRMDGGAYFECFLSCDGAPWEKAASIYDDRSGTATVTVKPNRCDKFRVMITGEGKCDIEAVTREFYLGSEI